MKNLVIMILITMAISVFSCFMGTTGAVLNLLLMIICPILYILLYMDIDKNFGSSLLRLYVIKCITLFVGFIVNSILLLMMYYKDEVTTDFYPVLFVLLWIMIIIYLSIVIYRLGTNIFRVSTTTNSGIFKFSGVLIRIYAFTIPILYLCYLIMSLILVIDFRFNHLISYNSYNSNNIFYIFNSLISSPDGKMFFVSFLITRIIKANHIAGTS